MRVLFLTRLREQLQGFWVVPGAVAAGYALLAFLLIRVDRASPRTGAGLGFGGDAAAARGVLSSVAGGIISMTSLTLSLTIVTLQLASSQFTPRALKNLLGDRVNQLVAGSFVGTVAYALLVLRVVREDTGQAPGFVPALSVTVCIGLTLLALALLLLFVHHVGQIIKVENIAARIGQNSLRRAQRLYPEPYGDVAAPANAPQSQVSGGKVYPPRPGYLQSISLHEVAAAFGGRAQRVEVLLAPGDFATPEQPMALVWPSGALGDHERKAVQRALVMADERDLAGDIGFGIRQLADIALRGVSPGINDPTTAVTCIGYITAILERLAGHDRPSEERYFAEHGVRVHAHQVPFESHLETGFLEIARYASSDPRVIGALLEGLHWVADAARAADAAAREQAARDLAKEIGEAAADAASLPRDQTRLQQHTRRLDKAPRVGQPGSSIR